MHILLERVKKNQLDAQLTLSIFRQLLHVSGISRPIVRRHNRMYTTIATVCCLGWIGTRTTVIQEEQNVPTIVYVWLNLLMMGVDTPGTCRG